MQRALLAATGFAALLASAPLSGALAAFKLDECYVDNDAVIRQIDQISGVSYDWN